MRKGKVVLGWLMLVGVLATVASCARTPSAPLPEADSVIIPGPNMRFDVNSLAISADEQTLVSGVGYDGVYIWDTGSGALLRTMAVDSVASAISPDANIVATSQQNDKAISLWNVADGSLVTTWSSRDVEDGGTEWPEVRAMAFSADGARLVAAHADGVLTVWEAPAGALLTTLGEPRQVGIIEVTFSPDASMVARALPGKKVEVWDVASGQMLQTLQNSGMKHWPGEVAWSPDGRWLAVGSHDNSGGALHLWATEDWRLRRPLDAGGKVYAVSFDPTGATLASGTDNGEISLWRVADGARQQTLRGHSGRVRSLTWSADGATLVSAGVETTIQLWDVESGATKVTLTLPELPLRQQPGADATP